MHKVIVAVMAMAHKMSVDVMFAAIGMKPASMAAETARSSVTVLA